MNYRCPRCKGTDFSVREICFQEWDSENDEWGDIDVDREDDNEDEPPYYCMNCESSFEFKDLETYDPDESETQATIK